MVLAFFVECFESSFIVWSFTSCHTCDDGVFEQLDWSMNHAKW
jgi:hypothetical protein